MTELLKDLMNDRADALGAPDLDVLGIVRDGNRRVNRRRTAVLGAGVAAAVVAAFAVPTLLRDAPQRATEVSFAAAFTAHEPSYAIGSEVHIDGRSFDVGHSVHAFVQTTAGVVFTDESGTVWASDGSRTVEVGTTEAELPRLEADGPRVAWTAYPKGAAPEYTVLDQSTGELLRTPFDTGNDGATEYDDALFAVDGVDVYFRDSRGIVRWNVESGEQTSLGRPLGLEVQDAKAGMMAQELIDPDEGTSTIYFGRDFRDVGSAFYRTLALSPDGRWALGEESSDTPALADTADGDFFSIDVPDYGFFAGYGWVDDDTYVGLGLNEPWETTPADLLECEVFGRCTVIGSAVGTFGADLVIPIGRSMDD